MSSSFFVFVTDHGTGHPPFSCRCLTLFQLEINDMLKIPPKSLKTHWWFDDSSSKKSTTLCKNRQLCQRILTKFFNDLQTYDSIFCFSIWFVYIIHVWKQELVSYSTSFTWHETTPFNTFIVSFSDRSLAWQSYGKEAVVDSIHW